ncbi:MAG TPA: outer membrane protein assembly factor BamA [Opitutaceae bacterium]|nr:outer membrane protein assembly factor BamA [Opitutaceae bacterium]
MKTISRNTPAWGWLGLLIAVLVFAGLPAARAQVAGEPQITIGKVDVKFLGVRNVSEQVVRANIQIREGATFDEGIVDRDVRNLYRTGLFELIEVKKEEESYDRVNLVVEVTPKFRVLSVELDGNHALRRGRLMKEITTKPNSALDERQIKSDTQKIFELYQKKGFSQAEVNYSIERDRTTGFGRVIFRIREGLKTKIQDIRFVGNDSISARKLRGAMEETRRHWMFSWLTGKGRLQDDKFEEDLDKLRDFYRERGYLDVDIVRSKVQFEYPKPGRLVIMIPVEEGRRYKIGRIGFVGNKLFPARFLSMALNERPGNWFVPSKLDKDVEALEEFYGKGGYLDTRIRLVRKPNLATGAIDIDYDITEGEKVTLESIDIEGNDKTKSIVILRELVLAPGQVFDSVRMNVSKLRLQNTRFFDDVNLTPEQTNVPGRRNLKVKVTEARTGNLTFGAGYSSLEKAVFYAELSQGNFDLFNRRSFFQGDGQKFRIRFQIGSQSNEIALNFEEPWFLEKQIAVGFELHRTASDYTSSYYEVIATGGSVYTRKRLFELFEGQLSYSYENIKYQDISTSNEYLASLLDSHDVSRVSFTLLRDTRDKMINTTRGNRIELTTQLAGGPFGGERDFYSVEFKGAQFVPLFKAQEQVLAILLRAGVIEKYGDTTDDQLYYYNYTLGGPNTLRGFEYREVGPKTSSGIILGGKSYGMFSLEYSLDIVSPVRFAVFYDAGFVNRGAYDFNPGQYNDNFGFGIRMMVMGSPMSLDYGIPLTGDKFNKQGGQFNFSYGTRF